MHASQASHISRADALGLWYDVTLGGVRADTPDLTARQMAVLMTVYLTCAPHTVRSLAGHLDVTKAVITRALDALGKHGFVDRARDPRDGRSVLVQRTGRGSSYLTDFADRVRGRSRAALLASA
ncbi:MAG: MarR family transcriptional regulator [Robiginitomaculum sp.]